MTHHLVIGLGEVGKAVYTVLATGEGTFVQGQDLATEKRGQTFDAIHICFPFSDKFIEVVKGYQKSHLSDKGDRVTVVHSSVPVGTCRQLDAVHSPIRGLHPNLVSGIRSFVKYFAGKDAYKAAKYFELRNVATRVLEHAEITEAAKMWDTAQFGWMILLNKAMRFWCEEQGLNFEIIYREWNQTYNEGYRKLGKDQFCRPYFDYVPGPIGGHCVVENARLLDCIITDAIQEVNEELIKTGKMGV